MRGAWLFAALALSCRGEARSTTSTGGAPSASARIAAAAVSSTPKAESGAELVARFECLRCHDDESSAQRVPSARDDKHCFHCHRAILDGALHAREGATTSRWKRNVEQLGEVPSLVGIGKRLRRPWIAGFLVAPRDLRPHLEPTMPGLAVTPDQADAIASYYARDEPPSADERSDGDAAKGRALIEQKGCGDCHVFTGVPPLKTRGATRGKPSRAFRLAPDLRFARERYDRSALVAWLRSPRAVKPDTLMPETGFDPDEAHHVAAYLLDSTLAPPPAVQVPERLPILERAVSFAEVDAKVFHKMCWHCHSEPDFAIGNGGPGNTGGFGFVPRGLNLASYEGIASGALDEHGERRSVFTKAPDGEPRLLSALFGRQREEAELAPPEGSLRGMPLGLPALEPADVQLVESWIAQGRPR